MAKNHGKNTPALTYPEMVEAERQKKGSKVYKIEASEFAEGRISSLVGKAADDLLTAATAEPVTLTDLEDVQRRTVVYVKACEAASTVPNIAGLVVALGLSRSAFYECIANDRPAATAKWFSLCRDAFSDILGQASLRNDVNSIFGIFQQKAMYGWRESIEIVAAPALPMGEEVDSDALKKRILGSVPAEDFDFDTESEDY